MLLSFTMSFFYKYDLKKFFSGLGKTEHFVYVLYVLLKRRFISVDYRNDYKALFNMNY